MYTDWPIAYNVITFGQCCSIEHDGLWLKACHCRAQWIILPAFWCLHKFYDGRCSFVRSSLTEKYTRVVLYTFKLAY